MLVMVIAVIAVMMVEGIVWTLAHVGGPLPGVGNTAGVL